MLNCIHSSHLGIVNVLSVQLTAKGIPRKLLWKLKLHPVHGRLYKLLCMVFKDTLTYFVLMTSQNGLNFQNLKIKPVGTLFFI